ncbi:hypothetical protein ABK040_000860 [Willaertia magna]
MKLFLLLILLSYYFTFATRPTAATLLSINYNNRNNFNTNNANNNTTQIITCGYLTTFLKNGVLNDSVIVAADSYSFLLVKKTLVNNITTFEQFLTSSTFLTIGIPNSNAIPLLNTNSLNAQQFIQTFHLNDDKRKAIVNVPLCMEDVTLTSYRGVPHYDVLLLTDANIANYLDVNFNEFHPIILFPSRLCLLNNTNALSSSSSNIVVDKKEEIIVNEVKSVITEGIFSRDFSDKLYNGKLLSSLIGLGNIPEDNLMKIFKNSLNSNLIYNSSYYNTATQQLKLYENVTSISLTWNEIVTRLMKCNVNKNTAFDFHVIYIFVCTILQIIFWVLVVVTKLYKKPSFKRRLLVPYVFAPSFIIVYTSSIYHIHSIFLRIFGGCLVFALLSVYTLTVIRFYYLRNLYHILQNSNNYKIHKILSSNRAGYIITSVIPLFIFFIWWMIYLLLVKYVPSFSANYINIVSIVAVILSSSLAILCLIVDLILNARKIQKDGWKKFLFFDDPFYLRIDLVCITGILALTIIFTIPVNLGLPVGLEIFLACDFFIYLLLMLMSGGTALIIHLFNGLKEKQEQLTETLTNTLKRKSTIYDPKLLSENNFFYFQKLLQNNSHFYLIFRDYAEKEFSLENLLLFDKIKEFSKRGENVTINELLEVKKEFIDRFSKSEVNISSPAKSKFLQLVEDCNQSETKTVDCKAVENILLYDVLLNLADTNDRLTQTSYFQAWEQVYEIQLKENVV